MDADELLARARAAGMETDDVPLSDGSVVKVRSLTRSEALQVVGKPMPYEVAEQVLISTAMVDPVMTKEQVAAWQAIGKAGDVNKVAARIEQLSGLKETAAKEAYATFRE